MRESTRLESDSMGEVSVPMSALYGASTQRAVHNFRISGEPMDTSIIQAYGLIKWAASRANTICGEITDEQADLIQKASREIYQGKLAEHFPIDTYQTGSGTSTNMNINEVIANRCSQYLGHELGSAKEIHPNDHVNKGQSSNDTFPSAIHIATGLNLKNDLIPALEILHAELLKKSRQFHPIWKIGRTHLMDATPIRLGQEFGGYAAQIQKSIIRANQALEVLREIPLGGTAVGTGLNAHPDFAKLAIDIIAEKTDIPFRKADHPSEAQAARDALVECHGMLNTIATSLYKISNDVRLMASGPRCGIGEITLPPTQPGSSIMPGKVNPVICEAVAMVAARVFGNQATVTWCGANGNLELNTLMPLMAKSVLESIRLLANVSQNFAERCIHGMEANEEHCQEMIEKSLSLVTALVPLIGYDEAAKIAKKSSESNTTIRELCEDRIQNLNITQQQLDDALDLEKL
ncbi:MAG: fumarate hydratase class II [Cryomorphaceae bacterium]|jgi:fumarate hydratase class II